MDIIGNLVKKIREREGISSKNGQPWKQAEFLLEIKAQFTKRLCFSVRDGSSGRIAYFEKFVGKDVKVSFDIDAHEYEGRWYNEINAWGIMEHVTEHDPTTKAQPVTDEKDSDLPF